MLEVCWQRPHVIHTFFAAVYHALFVTKLSLSTNEYVSFICVKISMENMIILLENIEKSYPKVNCSKENTCLQVWSVLMLNPLLIVMAFTIILMIKSPKYFNGKIPQYERRVQHFLLMHYWLVKYSTYQMSELDTAKS
jgi:hypothetical protein